MSNPRNKARGQIDIRGITNRQQPLGEIRRRAPATRRVRLEGETGVEVVSDGRSQGAIEGTEKSAPDGRQSSAEVLEMTFRAGGAAWSSLARQRAAEIAPERSAVAGYAQRWDVVLLASFVPRKLLHGACATG